MGGNGKGVTEQGPGVGKQMNDDFYHFLRADKVWEENNELCFGHVECERPLGYLDLISNRKLETGSGT